MRPHRSSPRSSRSGSTAASVAGLRLVGIVLGFVGIVALVGFEPGGGDRAIWGSLAVVGATVCYALGGLYAGRRFVGLRPELVAFGSLCFASVFALPLGAANASAQISALALDEQISALALVGLALVLSGVALGTRRAPVAS